MTDSLLVTIPGGSTSNSLCSLSEANGYLTNSFYAPYGTIPPDWDAMDTSEQESLLILAGMVLNGMSWYGWQVYEDQAMCWPRWLKSRKHSKDKFIITGYGIFPDDSSEYFTAATAKFPESVKKAQALFAYDVMYRGLQGRTSAAVGPATDAIKSINLFGDVSLTFDPGQEVPMRDLQNLNSLLRIRAYEIYELLAPHVTEFNFIGHWEDWEPERLKSITPTT